MYKVKYETLGIMPDGRIGNVYQGGNVLYTDVPIEEIRHVIDIFLGPKKRVCEILAIEALKGHVISKEASNDR